MEWQLRQALWAALLAALLPVSVANLSEALPRYIAHLQRYQERRQPLQREALRQLLGTGPPAA